MKRILSWFLVLMLLLGTLPALAEPAPADAAEAAGLPAVGDVVEGFEVKELRPFEMIGATLVSFEHQKTGAKLLYIANEDTNRAFQLTFPTRPVDNTGLPHVFEHSTLSGSEKYPSSALFFNLIYQSYTTFVNAYTADIMTCYPVGSLSEAQLLAMADLYTDSCLHPMVMKDESIYRTEAWRYEMEDMDSPLTLNGTVYSEMTGALSLQRTAQDNARAVTFPGAAAGFDPGGIPEFIPDMTWDSLKEYHNRFYHPSNCLAFLYGSFEDYTAFLKLLNEAFAPYEKLDLSFSDSGYTRITEPVVKSVPYAVAEGTDTVNQSSIYYYVLCPGLKDSTEEQRIIDSWFDELGFNMDKVLEACDQTVRITTPTFKYVNTVLENWAEQADSRGTSVNSKTVSQNTLNKYYEYLRSQAEKRAEGRRREVYDKLPEIRQIDINLQSLSSRISRGLLGGSTVSDMDSVKQEIRNLEKERAILLTENNYALDYTDVKYLCPKCSDTGIDENGRRCSCARERMGEAELWQNGKL